MDLIHRSISEKKLMIVWTVDRAVECMERLCLVWLLIEAMAHVGELHIRGPSRVNTVDQIHQIHTLLFTREWV
jgi:hypothetical protein